MYNQICQFSHWNWTPIFLYILSLAKRDFLQRVVFPEPNYHVVWGMSVILDDYLRCINLHKFPGVVLINAQIMCLKWLGASPWCNPHPNAESLSLSALALMAKNKKKHVSSLEQDLHCHTTLNSTINIHKICKYPHWNI